MLLKAACSMTYEVEEDTLFVFNIRPSRADGQTVHDERITVRSGFLLDDIREEDDWHRLTRVHAKPGTMDLRFETIAIPPIVPPGDLSKGNEPRDYPADVFFFLEQSRYCPSDVWGAVAEDLFGTLEKRDAPAAIAAWIKENVAYTLGTSTPQTTAVETYLNREGVCRDFAHLAITFCRALQIPARYTACYAWKLDPPDFHAVFEAYIDGVWQIFDPTGLAETEHLIRIASGLDAAQVASASIFGTARLLDISVSVEPTENTTL